MPIIERIALHGRISNTIKYITNPDKTDGEVLVSSYNCSVVSAAQEMEMTRRKFHIKNNDDRIGYHIIHSFDHDDNITPQQAHEIGERLVKELYPDHEAVIATHIDKLHLHNHIVINSININDGKKLNDKLSDEKGSLYSLRDVSNSICKEYGCKVMKDRTITSYRRNKFSKYIMSQRMLDIQNDLEDCIENSNSFDMVFEKMKEKNYRIRMVDEMKFIKIKHPDKNDKRWYNINELSNGQYSYSNLKNYFENYYEDGDQNMIEFIDDEVFLNKVEKEIRHYRNIMANDKNDNSEVMYNVGVEDEFYLPPVDDSILNEEPPPDYNDDEIDIIGEMTYDEYEPPDFYYDIPLPGDEEIPPEKEEEIFNDDLISEAAFGKPDIENVANENILSNKMLYDSKYNEEELYTDNTGLEEEFKSSTTNETDNIENLSAKEKDSYLGDDNDLESLMLDIPPETYNDGNYEQQLFSNDIPEMASTSVMPIIIDDDYLSSLVEQAPVKTEADKEYENQMSFLNKRNFINEPKSISYTIKSIQVKNDRTIAEMTDKVIHERKETYEQKKREQSDKKQYRNIVSLDRSKRTIKNKAIYRLEAKERYKIFSESKTADLISLRHLDSYEDIANERIKLMYDIDKFQNEIFELKERYYKKDVIKKAVNIYTMYYKVYQKYQEQSNKGDKKMLITYKDELAKFNGASSYLKKIYGLDSIDIKSVRKIHTSLNSIIQQYNQDIDIVKRKTQELNVLNDFVVEYDINNRENIISFSFARKRISSFNDSDVKKISELFPDYPQNSIKVVIPYLDDCVGIFDARDVINRSGEACKLYLDRDSNYLIYDKNGNEIFYTGSSLTEAIEKAKKKSTSKYKYKNYDKENRYASRYTKEQINKKQNEKELDEIQKENL